MIPSSLNQMLGAHWRQRDREAPWGRRLLGLLAVLGLVTGLLLSPNGDIRYIVLCTALGALLEAAWLVVVGSLLEQNHPHAARFVPEHVKRLREAALLLWALTTLPTALLLWSVLQGVVSLPALLLGCAAAAIFMAWAMRWWTLWLVACFGPMLIGLLDLRRRLAPLWSALGDLWQAQPWSVTALSLLALGWLLVRVFSDGGEAHRADYARRSRMRQASRDGFAGNRAGLAAFGRPGEWLAAPFEHGASAWLRHTLGRARATEASVMDRAEIVLHGNQHWLRQLMGVAVAFVMVGLGFALAFALVPAGALVNWQSGAFGMSIGLASAGFNPCFALPGMLWHTRREQALLVLLPGMPQGRRLSRAVAWRQLRHALVAALLCTLGLGLLATKAQDPSLFSFALGALPAAAFWLLRSPASLRAPSAWAAVLPVLVYMAAAIGIYVLSNRLGVSLALLAGISLAATASFAAWRWRRIGNGPAALPAGRLA